MKQLGYCSNIYIFIPDLKVDLFSTSKILQHANQHNEFTEVMVYLLKEWLEDTHNMSSLKH